MTADQWFWSTTIQRHFDFISHNEPDRRKGRQGKETGGQETGNRIKEGI